MGKGTRESSVCLIAWCTYFLLLYQVDTFVGSDIGECDAHDVGDSYEENFELVLRHSGHNGGHLEWARISAVDGAVFECGIHEKLDDEITKTYSCTRIHDGQYELTPPTTTTTTARSTSSRSEDLTLNAHLQGWRPLYSDKQQFIQVYFESTEVSLIYSIIVSGGLGEDLAISSYVTSYYVMYSWEGVVYSYVEDKSGNRMVNLNEKLIDFLMHEYFSYSEDQVFQFNNSLCIQLKQNISELCQ